MTDGGKRTVRNGIARYKAINVVERDLNVVENEVKIKLGSNNYR